MFRLDNKFLEDLGLGDLPEEQKKAFLQHIYSELEMRVGEKLTEGMNDAMLDEFGSFVDKNVEKMKEWFAAKLPDYANSEDFQALQQKTPAADEATLLSEFGAMKWLQINRPDYPQVVAATLEELKKEIAANREKILAK
ncbi:MAG: DUF5663 domain-containing protein [Candidatus Nomurabacteria bacterium]|jgi:hypothetical protein|nr:DUF5663 domain-containing protein [Candidatus Nomurabacteria bacterium]